MLASATITVSGRHSEGGRVVLVTRFTAKTGAPRLGRGAWLDRAGNDVSRTGGTVAGSATLGICGSATCKGGAEVADVRGAACCGSTVNSAVGSGGPANTQDENAELDHSPGKRPRAGAPWPIYQVHPAW